MLGYDETLYEVKRRYEAEPDRYFWCDQYSNMNNPQAHYDTTAEEILELRVPRHHALRRRRRYRRHHQRW